MATHKWSEIKDKLAPERRDRLDNDVRREILAMDPRELREEAGKTQAGPRARRARPRARGR